MRSNDVLGFIFAGTLDEKIPELAASRTTASVPIGGKYRLIDFVLSNMSNSGINNVGIVAKSNFLSLTDHVGSGSAYDLSKRRSNLTLLTPYGGKSFSNLVETIYNMHGYIEHCREEYVLIELPMSDFLTDGEDKNHFRIKEALKSLHQKTFTYADDGVWECFSIIANPKIRLRSSKVSFIVDARVWDVLLDFSRGFSRYDLGIAFTLESSYAMRLYEMMAGQKEPISYSIEALRKEFKLEDKYRMNKDFIKRVIESAKSELDEKSPVTFTYTPLKEGRKIAKLMFFPVRHEENQRVDLYLKKAVRKYGFAGQLSKDEYRFLREIGFTESGIKNNFALFMECQKQLDFIYELALIKGKSRTKKNPCGWCIKTLKGKIGDALQKTL